MFENFIKYDRCVKNACLDESRGLHNKQGKSFEIMDFKIKMPWIYSNYNFKIYF